MIKTIVTDLPCRECNAPRGSKKFKHNYKNYCHECFNKRLRKRRQQPEVKLKHNASVRKAIQASPESFLKELFRNICKIYKYRLANLDNRRYKSSNSNRSITVTLDDLLNLYHEQNGCCAISKLKMVHKHNNLRSISIDRIDNSIGYVFGNVQLVCKWINLAKSTHTNCEILEVLTDFSKTFTAGNHGLEPEMPLLDIQTNSLPDPLSTLSRC